MQTFEQFNMKHSLNNTTDEVADIGSWNLTLPFPQVFSKFVNSPPICTSFKEPIR